jgi:cytochrome P450
MILFLAQHPEAQDRLYREIQAAESEALDGDIDGDAPTAFACALKMPYLENLILEAYRSHSTFSLLIERVVSSKGMELPIGQYLPPGTFVGINSAAMNRRPDVYGADAESFNPERWVRAAGESEEGFKVRKGRMDRAMMTFGYGSRS